MDALAASHPPGTSHPGGLTSWTSSAKAKMASTRHGDYYLKLRPPPSERTSAAAKKGGRAPELSVPVGLPVRETLVNVYQHKRQQIVWDCWVYTIFTAVFISVIYQLNNTADAFTTNQAIVASILTQQFDTFGVVTFPGQGAMGTQGLPQGAAAGAWVASTSGSLFDTAMNPAAVPGAPTVISHDPIEALKARSNGFYANGAVPGFADRIWWDPTAAGVSLAGIALSGSAGGAALHAETIWDLTNATVGAINATVTGTVGSASLMGSLSGTARGAALQGASGTGPTRGAAAGSMPGAPATGVLSLQNTYSKTFFDVGQFNELLNFLQGPFINGLYPVSHYNGDAMTATESQYIANSMLRLTHGVRLWQVRVSNNSCGMQQGLSAAYQQRFARKTGGAEACFGVLVPGNDARYAFGPPWNTTKFKWSPKVGSALEGLPGYGQDSYGDGGYVAYLGLDGTSARETLADLFESRWVDRATRALGIDFNVYNSDTNLLTVVRLMVDVLPTGFITPSYRALTFKINLYATPIDYLRAAGEVIVLLGVLYYLSQEVNQLIKSRPKKRYFSDAGNAFDLMLQALMAACIIYWAYFVTSGDGTSLDLNNPCDAVVRPHDPNAMGSSSSCFVELTSYAAQFEYAITFGGFLGLLMCFKFFKFFSISRRLNTMWLTLQRAAASLIGFLVGFGVLVAGFAFMGQMCFGATMSDFHNFQSAFSTLLRWPLGDFSYVTLAAARPKIAPIFFTLYMALVFLVCTNMVIAILTIAYEDVHKKLETEEMWKHAGSTLDQQLLREIRVQRNWFLRCCSRGRFGGDGRDWTELKAERYYNGLMMRLTEDTERNSHVDLLQYMEDVYSACTPSGNLFCGVNELCSLARTPGTSDPFCANGHKASSSSRSSRAAARADAVAVTGWRGAFLRLGLNSLLGVASPWSEQSVEAAANAARDKHAARRPPGDTSISSEELEAVHGHRCVAWRVMHAYHAFKDTTCLGPTDRHLFWGDSMLTTDANERVPMSRLGIFQVVKVSRGSIGQKRLITIEKSDHDRIILSNRSIDNQLKRRVPISSCVQVDASLTDPRRAAVYIEADATLTRKDSFSVVHDTVFDLIFASVAEKERFIEMLVKCVCPLGRRAAPVPPSLTPLSLPQVPRADAAARSQPTGDCGRRA